MQYLLADAELSTGQQLLSNSIKLNEAIVEAWNDVWFEVVSPDKPLWQGLCIFGTTLAALSIIFVSLQMASRFGQGQLYFHDLAASFVWPLVIYIFLAGNGNFLGSSVLLIRNIAHDRITAILNIQLFDVTVRGALADLALHQAVKQQITAINAQCQGKTGQEYQACIEANQAKIEEIIAEAERNGGTNFEAEKNSGFVEAIASAFTSTIDAVLIGFLQACQWAFVNLLEAALLMTATLAPVALGLSLLTIGGTPILAWGSSFLGLFAAALGYNLIVGLVAVVIVKAGAQSFSDFAFLTLLSIFAPILALALGAGGGIAVYQGLQQGTASIASGATDAASQGMKTAIIQGFKLLRKGK
jgi:hypothetical protein